MDMNFTPEDLAFRDEVRQFIADEHPKELLGIRYRQHLKREEIYAWHKFSTKRVGSPPIGRSSTAAQVGRPCSAIFSARNARGRRR